MNKTAITVVFALALAACASPSQWMVNDQGQKVRCAASGWGYIGAPLAVHSEHVCEADFAKVGYHKMPDSD